MNNLPSILVMPQGSHAGRNVYSWQLEADRFFVFIFGTWLSKIVYDLPVGNHNVFEAPIACRTILKVTTVAQAHKLPAVQRPISPDSAAEGCQRTASYAHRSLPVTSEGTGQGDDRCSVADNQDAPMLALEVTL